jgi:hypothetical protein
LNGRAGSEGLWTTDVGGEPSITTSGLRSGAGGPVTVTCVPIDSGIRLGADRDLDGHFNGSDCSDGDSAYFAAPIEVANVTAGKTGPSLLTWDEQTSVVGPALYYDVVSGTLSELRSMGLGSATTCTAGGLTANHYADPRPDPLSGEGYYYLVTARTPECSGGYGAGRALIESLDCTGF